MHNTITPVVVFAYNRPDTLAQLLKCLRGEQVPFLYVFSDGPKGPADRQGVKQVRLLLNEIDWCEKILVCNEFNMGLGKSQIKGIARVLSDFQDAIIFEDDLICVPGTYQYMVSALTQYRTNSNVMSISAWTHPRIIPKGIDRIPYFDGKADCWGWGTWRRAWDGMGESALAIYNKCVEQGIDVSMYGSDMPKMAFEADRRNLWAVGWWYLHLLRGGLCLRPPFSLVETTGWDGRGSTITPEMIGWANPGLVSHVSVPDQYPAAVENEQCKLLWQEAVDNHKHEQGNIGRPFVNIRGNQIIALNNFFLRGECEFIRFVGQGPKNNQARSKKPLLTKIKNIEILNLASMRLKGLLAGSQDVQLDQEPDVWFVVHHKEESVRLESVLSATAKLPRAARWMMLLSLDLPEISLRCSEMYGINDRLKMGDGFLLPAGALTSFEMSVSNRSSCLIVNF